MASMRTNISGGTRKAIDGECVFSVEGMPTCQQTLEVPPHRELLIASHANQ